MAGKDVWFEYDQQIADRFGIRLPSQAVDDQHIGRPLRDVLALPRDWMSKDRDRPVEKVEASDDKNKAKAEAEGKTVVVVPPGARTAWCSAHRHVVAPQVGQKKLIRRKVEEELSKRTFIVFWDQAVASAPCPVRFIVDPPILDDDVGRIWHDCGYASKSHGDGKALASVTLLTETSKMGCFSFNMPGGPPSMHGTCPSAGLGFYYGTGGELLKAQKAKVSQDIEIDPVQFTCSACVTGDTKVLVKGRGAVRVDELAGEPPFEVWSGTAWRTATARPTGMKPVVRLRTSFGYRLRLTEDHRVLTKNRGWVEAGQLLVGDVLLFKRPDPSFVPAASIEFPPEVDPHHATLKESFPTEWSYDIGTFLGHVMGNGTVSYGKYPTIKIMVGEKDVAVLERLRSVVASWCATMSDIVLCELREPKDNNLCPVAKERLVQIAWRVRRLEAFAAQLGLDKSIPADERRAPAGLWSAGTDAVRGFLAGLWGADGCPAWSAKGRGRLELILASVSRGLLRDTQLMLLYYFGIKSTICEYKTSNVKRESLGYRKLFKLSISSRDDASMFAKSVGFDNPRRQQQLVEHLAELPPLEKRNKGKHARVVAVEREHGPCEPVYDLSVDDDHSFLANGIIVHNCYAIKGNYGNPSNILGMQARLMLVRWLLDKESGRRTPSGAVPKQVVFLDEERSRAARSGTKSLGQMGEKVLRERSYEPMPMGFAELMVYAITEAEKRSRTRISLLTDFGYTDAEFVEAARRAKVKQQYTVTPAAERGKRPVEANEYYGWEVSEPGFFRIHDAGDCWQEDVLEAWVKVARAMPKVRFWMPTRTWAVRKRLRPELLHFVPPNLVIRPSALHLREDAPSIADMHKLGYPTVAGWRGGGLAAGSGSTLGPIPKGGWECPAYRHYSEGGGALLLASEVKKPGGKESDDSGVGGMCVIARGMDGEGGCRVCWGIRGRKGTNYSRVPVFYHEH